MKQVAKIPEYISIWILTDDPFGDDRMLYTVKNVVVENSELVYNDCVIRLYLVGNIKHSSETEDRYMTLQEIIDHEKDSSYSDGVRAGVQQGMQQGLEQGIKGIIRTCQNLNQTKEKTIETLARECNITQEEAEEYIRLHWQEENETN